MLENRVVDDSKTPQPAPPLGRMLPGGIIRYPFERSKYVVSVLVGFLGAVLYVSARRFFAPLDRPITDFDVFHLVGQMVSRGDAAGAYDLKVLGPAQEALNNGPTFFPWTYPPPFGLLVGPLGQMPLGLAYSLFTISSLGIFLIVLRAVAGRGFALLFILFYPAFVTTIASGQNGFLTGSLVGIAAILLMKGQAGAGVPLGLLAIKPHLAVTLAVFVVARRTRWKVALIAAATGLAFSLLATVLLGPSVWPAFLDSVKASAEYLRAGLYQFHRMVSPYATLRSLGVSATGSSVAQLLISGAVLIATYRAAQSGFGIRQTVGIALAGALLVTPYAYDYDLTVYCIGMALLLPEVALFGRRGERIALYGLTFATGAVALAQSRLRLELFDQATTFAGLMLAVCYLILWRILIRSRSHAEASSSHNRDE